MVGMPEPPSSTLWQAVHAAYEARDLNEARRLLCNGVCQVDFTHMPYRDDVEYITWLLSHQLLPPSQEPPEWPTLQERQLQCDALDESARPRCILQGEWEEPPPAP